MKNATKFWKLLKEYRELRDFFVMTSLEKVLYDAMAFDITGFDAEAYDDEQIDELLPTLEKQVKAFRLIKKGWEQVDYTFG